MKKIYESHWWNDAQKYPDRHYPKDSGVMLSDHLEKVTKNVQLGFTDKGINQFYSDVNTFLHHNGLLKQRIKDILIIVSLLHDIGKPIDDKNAEITHPLSNQIVKKRHNVVGVIAALEIFKNDSGLSDEDKDIIYQLVDEHDTSYGWYMQYSRSNIIPKRKSWEKLDKKISDNIENFPLGIVLLAIFKLADIDGHDDVSDVIWFIEQLNVNYLREKGLFFPEPSKEDLLNYGE